MDKKVTRNKQWRWPRLNGWKWATLLLCGLLLGGAVWFGVKVLTPYQDQVATTTAPSTQQPAFTVSLTKRQVNRIVDYYLNDYLKDSKIKYTLTVGNQAVLSGKFKFFGQTVQFDLLFDPLVKSTGDVELKARKLNVGSLPVPIAFVLNYVGHSYKLPSWVTLDSKKETITLRLSKFILANKMHIEATKMDLVNDEINFAVYLPKQ